MWLKNFSTYRFRIFAYTILLVAFLTATLAYTYIYSRNAILEEAENNVTNTALLLNGNIETEESELLHYAEFVRDDLRIKEYVFMVIKGGTDNEVLDSLYKRHYGWLPIKRQIILGNNGRILLGSEHQDLARSLVNHLEVSGKPIFYSQSGKSLEMVTWAPISYQGTRLGVVALTHTIDNTWLKNHQQYSGGYLFIENDGVILQSNLPGVDGEKFELIDGLLNINGESYQIRPITLSGTEGAIAHLWYGVSMRDLLDKLERHSRIVLLLTLSGAFAIMWLGLVIVRNFSRPLTELVHITRAVANGNLPVMNQTQENNEVGILSNQFAEMLQALRAKQEQIDDYVRQLHEKNDYLLKLQDILGHDIKTPLEAALRRVDDEKTIAYLQLIKKALSQAKESSSLHDYANQTPEYEKIDLNEFLLTYQTGDLFENIKVNPCQGSLLVSIDTFMIEQSISAILSNANEFRSPGTTISIKTFRDNDYAVIEIKNVGSSIDETKLDTIFNYGVSMRDDMTSTDHYGQGLYIAKSFIRKHSGKIHVNNIADGVVFTISLPTIKS